MIIAPGRKRARLLPRTSHKEKRKRIKEFVKRFFELFLFGREILFYFTQLRIGERLFAPVCLLTLLLYHTFGGLSRGFFEELDFFILYFCGQCPVLSLQPSVSSKEMATCHTPSGKYLISSPLDNYSIAFREYFVNSFFHIFRRFFSLTL